MALSRSSSPASRGATPELLTPRSKIKALLAIVESSDEEDGTQTNTKKKRALPRYGTEQQGVDKSGSDVQIRPRGKLASRMQGIAVVAKETNTAAMVETARDRVKRMLQREEEQAGRITDTKMDIVDEDDEIPVAPRYFKRQVLREPSVDTTKPTIRSPSPGLFMSSQSEPEDDLPAVKSGRFKALIERKRQERLTQEAAEESRKAERAQQEKLASELELLEPDEGNTSSITDDEGGRRLTQQARPTRKASKRAIDEMNRETQRMARSMQLTHEAKTRKKLSKASLFERFNFKPAGGPVLQPKPQVGSSSRPATPQTDVEMEDKETPPSSPPLSEKQDCALANIGKDITMDEPNEPKEEDLPPLLDLLKSTPLKVDKGKGKALAFDIEETGKSVVKPKRQIRVRMPMPIRLVKVGSDDELRITTTTKDKINAVFDSIPFKRAQEPHSVQALRALACVRSPSKNSRPKGEHARMTQGELQAYLQQKAKQQAKSERDRRLEMLKAQGMVIQTSEERERQMQEVEDILARARDEAQQIMQEERAVAEKERKENGEVDPLAWDDSDEEYEDSVNDVDAGASSGELSGSDAEDEDEEGDAVTGTSFEPEAEDPEPGAAEAAFNDENKETEAEDKFAEEMPPVRRKRARNHAAVLSDDEVEAAVEATPRSRRTPVIPASGSPFAPTSVLRSAKKAFIPGLPVQGPAGLGLTQIFAGTMDDSQKSRPDGPMQSMMPDFDHFPDSNFSATMDSPIDDIVLDSQRVETQKTTQGVCLNLSQTQMHGLDSLIRDDLNSQVSEMMELSQDCGFQEHTPLKQRFVEPPLSTVETVVIEQRGTAVYDFPLACRGRLRRKIDMPPVSDQPSFQQSGYKKEMDETAFAAMNDGVRQAKKKLMKKFNPKRSKAKEMVNEEAEESEDEYAGLGGADGEDSDNESNESVQDIIDDAAGNDVDERKLAAFYADRERAKDEKQVEKLYKDITSGLLRRKRGADYDLSDSDDGGEARQRMKRRQFAKMQKALFADERVKKIAEDPGNQAFLRTIEDRGSDDELDLLDVVDAPLTQVKESQSQEDRPVVQEQRQKQTTIPNSQPRRPLGNAGENRAPAYMRRTKDGKKPSNIGEVRETLSDLLEEHRSSVIPATEIGSGSEDEESPRGYKENNPPGPRRSRNALVDRISFGRNASSTMSSANRLAFSTTGAAASSSFKVPALLRRATTNSSFLSGSTASTSASTMPGSAGGFGEEAMIKKGAGKKSGVHGFARDGDRRARMQESERRRQEKKVRGAESRVGLVGGLLGKGSFE